MIAELGALVPSDACVGKLYELTESFDKLAPGEKLRVLPAMFGVMERCPGVDLGSPGPLVHLIESQGVAAYETLLLESVRRRPMYLNLWMVNRILNVISHAEQREGLLTLLRDVRDDPMWAGAVSEEAAQFLAIQAERPAT